MDVRGRQDGRAKGVVHLFLECCPMTACSLVDRLSAKES